jgi:hypothetical protein
MRSWVHEHRTEIKLFIALWVVYAFYVTPAGGVTPNRYLDLVHSIVNEGRFEIDTYHENTVDKAQYNGHYYAGALPGPAFITVPVYVLFKGVYVLVPDSVKETAAGIQSYKKEKLPESSFYGTVDNTEFFLSQAFLVVFGVSVAAAAAVVFFFKILCLLQVDQRVALWLALCFGLGTILFWNATVFFEQAFTVVFSLAAFYLLLRMKRMGYRRSQLVVAGFLAGSAFLVEFSGAFVAACLFGYLVLSYQHKNVVFYLLGCSIPVLVLASYDYFLFGNPFSTPYQHLASPDFENIVKEGLVGVSYPRLDRIVGLVLSPERGVLLFAPITLAGFLGMILASSRRARFKNETLLFATLTLIGFLFVGSFRGWNAGGAFGPRYLLFALPFMILPAGFLFERSRMGFLYGIFIVSFIINWAGVQRGFADNYYQPLAELLEKGPTAPLLEAVLSHATTTNPLFEWIQSSTSLMGWLLIGFLALVIMGIWLTPGLGMIRRGEGRFVQNAAEKL